MNEKTPTTESLLPEHEQKLLDTALLESDQLLARSLHDDELRRRKRRNWWSLLLMGGAVMAVWILWIGFGLLGEVGSESTVEISDKAIVSERTALLEEVQEAEKLSKKGWAAWKRRDYSQAMTYFETAIQLDPQSVNAWNGSGWVQLNSGNAERARESFLECLKLGPKHPGALNGMGQIHLSWKEYDKAKKYLLRAARQNATASWSGLARLFLLEGEFKKAKVWTEKLLNTDQQDSLLKEMHEAAIAGKLSDALRQRIEPQGKQASDSTEGKGNFQQAWQLFFRGNYRTSEAMFREALKDDAKNPHAMNGLGWSLLNQGKHDKAKPWLEKAIQLEKNHWGALNGLAVCLKAEGKLDEAIPLWERIDAANMQENSATMALAPIYLERKQYEKAQKCYKKLVKWFPDRKEYQQSLAEAKAGAAATTP